MDSGAEAASLLAAHVWGTTGQLPGTRSGDSARCPATSILCWRPRELRLVFLSVVISVTSSSFLQETNFPPATACLKFPCNEINFTEFNYSLPFPVFFPRNFTSSFTSELTKVAMSSSGHFAGVVSVLALEAV